MEVYCKACWRKWDGSEYEHFDRIDGDSEVVCRDPRCDVYCPVCHDSILHFKNGHREYMDDIVLSGGNWMHKDCAKEVGH
jgi:hypothetical protein